jgi:hypothetical protein
MEQNYELGDEVLVRGVIEMLDYAQKPAKIKVGEDGFAWVEEVGELIPLSALDVNKQLLEALKPFAKLAAMFDHDIDDSWGIACESTGPIRIRDLRRARDALAAAEKGSRHD